MNLVRYACHGLGVIQPIDLLANDLNRLTPNQPRFLIVGGMNPPIEQPAIEGAMKAHHDRGAEFVWIGHSMGAALGFYLPQKHPDWKFRLIITVDPMDWASNIHCANWQTYPPRPGQWLPSGNYQRWINIHSDMYPGGGRLSVGGLPHVEEHHYPHADHIGIIALPEVRKIIFEAVEAVK